MEAKVKILFIDDDITFGRICTIILQEKGYEVFYQTTLNGAKACIAEAHPDIIVLDVEIGNQNGIEVAPEINSDSTECSCSVYLFSYGEPLGCTGFGSGCGGLS